MILAINRIWIMSLGQNVVWVSTGGDKVRESMRSMGCFWCLGLWLVRERRLHPVSRHAVELERPEAKPKSQTLVAKYRLA